MHEKAAKKARFSCKSTFFGAVFLSAAFRKFFTFLSYSLKPLKFQQFYKLPFQSEFSFWFSVTPLPRISHTFLAQCRLSYTKLLQKKQVFRVNIHLNTPEGYSPSQTCTPNPASPQSSPSHPPPQAHKKPHLWRLPQVWSVNFYSSSSSYSE